MLRRFKRSFDDCEKVSNNGIQIAAPMFYKVQQIRGDCLSAGNYLFSKANKLGLFADKSFFSNAGKTIIPTFLVKVD